MPQNSQNTIIQIEIKHYNQFINIIAEALSWLQIKIDTWNKLKVETKSKERDQKLPDFITI